MKRKHIIISFLILIFTMLINVGYSAWVILKDKQIDPGYDTVGIYNYIEDNQSVIYNGEGQAPYISEELTDIDGNIDDFTYKYKEKNSTGNYIDGRPTDVGVYTMVISSSTFGVAENITFNITKATPTINSVIPVYNQFNLVNNLIHNGYFTTLMNVNEITFNYDVVGVKGEDEITIV